MKTKKVTSTSREKAGDVDVFMAKLEHPLTTEIEAVRRMILGASAEIGEAIKWNAPSFRTTEFFATTNLRARDQVRLIFHLGAKVRKGLQPLQIAAPAGLLKWLAKDRCMVTVGVGKTVQANRRALQAIVRDWIAYV